MLKTVQVRQCRRNGPGTRVGDGAGGGMGEMAQKPGQEMVREAAWARWPRGQGRRWPRAGDGVGREMVGDGGCREG